MFQMLICRLKVTFKSRQVQLSGNRNDDKEALIWYVKIAINKWRELGAEVVIPKWDPRKHKAHSMEVDIMIAFDKQDYLPLLYGFWTCLQEFFVKMTDDILNNFFLSTLTT